VFGDTDTAVVNPTRQPLFSILIPLPRETSSNPIQSNRLLPPPLLSHSRLKTQSKRHPAKQRTRSDSHRPVVDLACMRSTHAAQHPRKETPSANHPCGAILDHYHQLPTYLCTVTILNSILHPNPDYYRRGMCFTAAFRPLIGSLKICSDRFCRIVICWYFKCCNLFLNTDMAED